MLYRDDYTRRRWFLKVIHRAPEHGKNVFPKFLCTRGERKNMLRINIIVHVYMRDYNINLVLYTEKTYSSRFIKRLENFRSILRNCHIRGSVCVRRNPSKIQFKITWELNHGGKQHAWKQRVRESNNLVWFGLCQVVFIVFIYYELQCHIAPVVDCGISIIYYIIIIHYIS